MAKLNTSANIARPDDFYAALLALHEGRSKEDSERINARLVLILANHIGDAEVLGEALTAAGLAGPDGGERP
jgi:5-carboxymethyl-2-hydroxymuconate isomerase